MVTTVIRRLVGCVMALVGIAFTAGALGGRGGWGIGATMGGLVIYCLVGFGIVLMLGNKRTGRE